MVGFLAVWFSRWLQLVFSGMWITLCNPEITYVGSFYSLLRGLDKLALRMEFAGLKGGFDDNKPT